MVLAFALRVAGPYANVIRPDVIRFSEVDAWYHVRLIEHLVRNFPRRLPFDPYLVFPTGELVPLAPLFDVLVASVAWATGGGNPSTRHIEIVAAFAPAVLGALTIVPVYFLARRLFGRLAAAVAAGVLAIMPGPFLQRTLLGYTDHHALEVLLVVATVMLTVRALDAPSTRRAIAAGASLGLYLLTWTGGALFVAVIAAWCVLQMLADHARGRSIDALASTIGVMCVVSLAFVFIPPEAYYRRETQVVALLITLATIAALWATAALLQRRRMPTWSLALLTLAAGVAGLALFAALSPVYFANVLQDLQRFGASDVNRTIGEIRPLLAIGGSFSVVPAWLQYRTALLLGTAGLAAVGWRVLRRGDSADSLVFTWCAAMLALTLAQQRFGYYLAPCLAVLTGFACTGIKRLGESAADGAAPSYAYRALSAAIIIGLAIVPLAGPAQAISRFDNGPTDAWIDAMRWLRSNTPEPIQEPGAFEAMYERPPNDGPIQFPATAYGVMTWWDYGYWVVRMAQRIPTANPTHTGVWSAARFYTATTPAAAVAEADSVGARYVIVNGDLIPRLTPNRQIAGTFASIAVWAGTPTSDSYEVYYATAQDGLQPVMLYYPRFFESAVARLYLFNGAAARADGLAVVSYTEQPGTDGRPFKLLHELRQFASTELDAARAYAAEQSGFQRRIVSLDPTRSCVELTEIADYSSVYASRQLDETFRRPAVKIFQRQGVIAGR